MTWMLQVGQNKGTECNEMRNFLLNVIVVTRVKRNSLRNKQHWWIMAIIYPTLPQGVFLWHPLEFNRFNRYRKYRNRIGSLLIIEQKNSKIAPIPFWNKSHYISIINWDCPIWAQVISSYSVVVSHLHIDLRQAAYIHLAKILFHMGT